MQTVHLWDKQVESVEQQQQQQQQRQQQPLSRIKGACCR